MFPVGVPSVLFSLLYTNREAIMDREKRSGDEHLSFIAFLFRLYHPHVSLNGSRRSLGRRELHQNRFAIAAATRARF